MFDRVHRALRRRLDDEKIKSPVPTQTLNRPVNPQNVEELSQAI
jgi:hypothetical protein